VSRAGRKENGGRLVIAFPYVIGAMLFGAMFVRAMLIGTMLIGTMFIRASLLRTMFVGAMFVRPPFAGTSFVVVVGASLCNMFALCSLRG
jgi:hypothetical protein